MQLKKLNPVAGTILHYYWFNYKYHATIRTLYFENQL